MSECIRFPIEESSQIAETRRIARQMASQVGFDEITCERIAIVVTEAGSNLVKYANHGEILLYATVDEGKLVPRMEVLALDQGPGMENLEQCLRDGYSTSSSPGQGLGAIKRLSNGCDFYTAPGKGTVLLARWSNPDSAPLPERPQRLHIGAVNIAKRSDDVCGDCWGSVQTDEYTTIVVADGLGHGFEARLASKEAIRMLQQYPSLAPMPLLERIHMALRSTRGAAVAVTRIDRVRGIVTFSGVGNISGQLYSGANRVQHLVSVNGTAGLTVRRFNEFQYPWPDRGMLVCYSDGLMTNSSIESPGLAQRDVSVIAGVLYRDFGRRQDDSTVVVAKAA